MSGHGRSGAARAAAARSGMLGWARYNLALLAGHELFATGRVT